MLRYFKKIKKTTIESFIVYAIYSLTLSLFPLVSQKFLDNYNKGFSYLINLFFIFLIIVLLNLISEYFNRVWEWKLAKEIQLIIEGKLFDSFISQDKKNFNDQKSIDYVSIINNNVY
ncbi:hypothetical protein BG261_09090 [Floricoccus tropicus]|uniref:ABC transmembrane type-1 domain-containing protein n=1 Tax=Floricoccus tropicus TaxID=1859473 RepID=A0A1E8GRK8_9LACT|nr:hypothetical protein BG261_09090 [Floricoccus tropicus]